MLHTCQVNDIAGDTHVLRGTLRDLHTAIGPVYPIVLDGKRGHLDYENDAIVFCPEV